MKLFSVRDPEVAIDFPDDICGTANPVENWEKMNRIGEGSYGIVYRAKHITTGSIVALKKVRMELENDGLPISSLREISLLKSLNHRNVITVHDVAVGYDLDNIFLVMEYCENDLAFLMDTVISKSIDNAYTPSQVKCLMHQLASGLSYIHKHYIAHRDLKPSNLLLTSTGVLKIADFGLARHLDTNGMTPNVVTLWYRSPELLLSDESYDLSIDIWSLGCIFGEILTAKPVMPGRSEVHQLELISLLLGSPTKLSWPKLKKLAKNSGVKFMEQELHTFKEMFNGFTGGVLHLLMSLLKYDEDKRLTIQEVLDHHYFRDFPPMCSSDDLPAYPGLRQATSDAEEKEANRKRKLEEMEAELECATIGPFNRDA